MRSFPKEEKRRRGTEVMKGLKSECKSRSGGDVVVGERKD